jgi:hypothetical protein
VAYLREVKNLEPEKQPLLANGSETKFNSRQQLPKHVPTARDTHATVKVLLERVLLIRSVQRGYKEDNWGNRVSESQRCVCVCVWRDSGGGEGGVNECVCVCVFVEG